VISGDLGVISGNLVVMEALLRGIPCVSSDVGGLPEANLNAELVAPASLSFDHARGTRPRHCVCVCAEVLTIPYLAQGMLVRGASNAQLEEQLGADPPLPDARERAKALAAAVPQVATAEEAAPFASRLRRLLDDGAYLRRMSVAGREAALAFAAGCAGGLARLLSAYSCEEGSDDEELIVSE